MSKKQLNKHDQAPVGKSRSRKPGAPGSRAKASAAEPRAGLTRETIIAAAMMIVDGQGLKALSMRRLGAELGFDPMAVYYHFPSKSALLDGLAEHVMAEIDLSRDDPSLSAEERLCNAASIYREALLSHPNAVPATAVHSLNTPASLRPVELVLGIFREAGFSAPDALAAVNIFGRYVRGSVLLELSQASGTAGEPQCATDPRTLLEQLPRDEFPYIHEVFSQCECVSPEAEFERGTRALMGGLLRSFATDPRKGDEDV